MELYRGKLKDGGQWVIGSVVCVGDRAFALLSTDLRAERPAYNGMAMGCGLEDRGLTRDAYNAMEYGWEEALERYEENFPVWGELRPDTVTRCCARHDCRGNVLFEGDLIRNVDNKLYEICYGNYTVFLPENQMHTENVGFFVVSKESEDNEKEPKAMPIGTPEGQSLLVGNIFDDLEPAQASGNIDQEAAQPVLMPAT